MEEKETNETNEKENAEIKPVVIFTHFWDANKIIEQGFILVQKAEKVYKVNVFQDEPNYSVHSIALSHPPLNKLPHLESMDRIDCFCPTYNLLHRYKDEGDWDAYVRDYKQILRDRKDRVKRWVSGLENNRVYILCCWENTSLKAKCHRKLVIKL